MTFTEPTTGQTLTKQQASQLVNNAALRETIKQFFTRSTAGLKVGTCCPSHANSRDWITDTTELGKGKEGGSCSDGDVPFLLPIQDSQVVTVEVSFRDRTEHVPITLTWEEYLDDRGLYYISNPNPIFYDVATGMDLTPGATLEAMGYQGGTLAVSHR
jgi:hypothetical protein